MNSYYFTAGFLYFDGSILTFSLRLRTAGTLQRFCGPKGRAEKHGCTVMSVGEPRVKGGQLMFGIMGDSFPWIGFALHFFSNWSNPDIPFAWLEWVGSLLLEQWQQDGIWTAKQSLWDLELPPKKTRSHRPLFPHPTYFPISIMSRLTTISQADLLGI